MEATYIEQIPAFWTRITASQIINDRAVILYGIQAYSAQTGGTLIIRDGQNTNAPIVCTIDVNDGQSKNMVISRGILLTHGLYVEVGSNITEVTVAWLPYAEPVKVSGERSMPSG